MPNRLLPILLALWLLVAGCSQTTPMESTQQWNLLANNLASRINDELIRQHYVNATVYVRHSCGKPNACRPGETFAFDEGFNDLLSSQLASFGILVRRTPAGADLMVEYKVQLVYHGDYEVIVTTSVMARDTFVLRSSDIFAIDKQDYWQYRQAVPATEIELTNQKGGKQPPQLNPARL